MINIVVIAALSLVAAQETIPNESTVWLSRKLITSFGSSGQLPLFPQKLKRLVIPVELPQAIGSKYVRDVVGEEKFERETLPKLVQAVRARKVEIAFYVRFFDVGAVAATSIPVDHFEMDAYDTIPDIPNKSAFVPRYLNPNRIDERLQNLHKRISTFSIPTQDAIIFNFSHPMSNLYHHSPFSREQMVKAIGFDPQDFGATDTRTLTEGFTAERPETQSLFNQFQEERQRIFLGGIKRVSETFSGFQQGFFESADSLLLSDTQRIGIGFSAKKAFQASKATMLVIQVASPAAGANLVNNFPTWAKGSKEILIAARSPISSTTLKTGNQTSNFGRILD